MIEWHGTVYATPRPPIDAEVLLREDSETVSAIYGAAGDGGASATIGFQLAKAPAYAAQLSCDRAGAVTAGTQLDVTPSRPAIAGTPQAGQPLNGADAQYTAGIEPIATRLQWRLCDAVGAGCADVPGATGAAFTPGADAVGRTVRLASTATNLEGSATTLSLPRGPVAAGPAGGGPGGAGTPGGPGAPGGPARGTPAQSAAAAPVLSKASLSAHVLSGKKTVTLRFRSSLAGRATVVLQRKASGRRAGKKCAPATHANRRAKACARWVPARTVRAAARAGADTIRLLGRGLAAGSYHVVLTVTSAAKRASRPVTLALTVRR